MTLLLSVSRGALELVAGKSFAYGIQVAAITLFLAILVANGARSTKRLTGNLVAAYAFVLAALASVATCPARGHAAAHRMKKVTKLFPPWGMRLSKS